MISAISVKDRLKNQAKEEGRKVQMECLHFFYAIKLVGKLTLGIYI